MSFSVESLVDDEKNIIQFFNKKKPQIMEEIELKGERMEPLNELVFSKYLKFEIIIPSVYKSKFNKTQLPNWYKIDPKNNEIIKINPEFEKIIEINGNKHFVYFVKKIFFY